MHGDHATENLLPPEAFPSYFTCFVEHGGLFLR
jgi:hypothetical protein